MLWDVNVQKRLLSGSRRFDLDLRFASDAKRLVLFGPSGAGKSLSLKALAGLLRPDSGHVRLAGDTLFEASARIDRPPQARRLAYLFQDYALFPHLTVRQNVGFGVTPGWRNPSRDVRHPDVEHWLQNFELDGLADQSVDRLSGGQRQRVALARALVPQPRALLLDEPFAALDRALRTRLRDELLALQARLALPVLLITHDEDDLAAFGGQVLRIQHGHLLPP
jgi:molybdate transport system ATP-binding protein